MFKFIKKEKLRILKFGLVGVSGIFVNLLFVWIGNNVFFHAFAEKIQVSLSYALGIIISIFTNFILNYFWTWLDKKGKTKTLFFKALTKYYVTTSFTGLVQFIISNSLYHFIIFSFYHSAPKVPGVIKYIPVAFAVGIASLLNFIINHFWTFKTHTNKTHTKLNNSRSV